MPPILAMWAANVVLGAVALLLLWLNHREAAFDPLDPSHYKVLLPRVRTRQRPEGQAARPRSGPGRRVVVLRVPRLSLPMPGILDRYIARSYLGNFLLVLTAFWALFVLVSFMDLFDDVQHNRVKGAVVLHYYAFASSEILHLLTPVAVLVSVLITFGVMARQNEITAIKAAGISVYRAVLPAIVIAMFTSFLMFEAAEYVLPPLNKIADRDFNVIKGRPPMASTLNQHRWILGSDGRFYNFDYFQLESRDAPATLYGLSVYDVDTKEWRLRDRLYAARAVWGGVAYDIERGWRRTFGPEGSFNAFHQAHRTREIEPPSYFNQEDRASDTMTFRELQRHIGSLEALGLDVTKLRVELHRKFAYPAVAVVMTLLGIPFAFVVARHGALYGVAISLIIAIVYWAVLGSFEALGGNAYLSAALAAWAPNLLFAAAGLYFLFTLET
jgi:LPS export ABC transporter permease LptG